MWPQLTGKEAGKCNLSSERSLLRLNFRESIAMREKWMLNIGGQLLACSIASDHNTRPS